jgi:hypothetical protein
MPDPIRQAIPTPEQLQSMAAGFGRIGTAAQLAVARMVETLSAADPTPAPRPASQLSAEASYRARQRGELPRVAWLICEACGARHKGTRHPLLCPSCWERLTPDGRQYRTDKVKRHAKRKRAEGVDGEP